MAADLAGLLEEHEVARTLYRFAAAIDTRDWAAYRAVFTDSLEVDYTSYRPGSVATMPADAWVARATALFPGLDATQHCLYNPLVDLDGDRARCRVYLQAEHVLPNPLGDPTFTIGGYYDDRLVRAGDSWLICAKKLVVTWSRGNRHVLTLGAERAAARY